MSSGITFELNGERLTVGELPGQSLLDVLRNDRGLMATRMGCGQGQCGACRVLLDDVAVPACDTPVWSVAGKRVTTLEGLGHRARPHPLQTAFIAQQALQCGFCTSGMIMTAAALLRRNARPTADEVRSALDDNLCRCGVHNRVVQAVLDAAAAV
ncbi:MAG: (2Fe-2S)-binding protein [Rhodoferax sp.]|nr:(2Fe-2S)-binding protein [Rhodoferax sp.]MCB2027637.1 (2Fe-2S)-binding protein [Rhodoferax sp.]MCB2040160.1 (2Fe-2S)-binding protein [Rhodoferax sp.]MCW5628396.1 (2Fe-2S)-binding protein [Rhodoferax sp.]